MAMQIQDLDPVMEFHSIKKGLRAGPFVDSLAINPSSTMAEFKERAVGYINMEEVQEIRKAEAQTKNRRAEDLRQSQKQQKRSQKRPKLGPREKS